MATIKRGTTPTLPVQIDLDMEHIATVDFLFKSKMLESDTVKVEKQYPTDVTYSDGIFYVEFSEEDTRTFAAGTMMYLDVKPTTTDGRILATEIVPIDVYLTLYPAEEVGDNGVLSD